MSKNEQILDKKIESLQKKRSRLESQIAILQKQVDDIVCQIEETETEKNTLIVEDFLKNLKNAGYDLNSKTMEEVLKFLKSRSSSCNDLPIKNQSTKPEEILSKANENSISVLASLSKEDTEKFAQTNRGEKMEEENQIWK